MTAVIAGLIFTFVLRPADHAIDRVGVLSYYKRMLKPIKMKYAVSYRIIIGVMLDFPLGRDGCAVVEL